MKQHTDYHCVLKWKCVKQVLLNYWMCTIGYKEDQIQFEVAIQSVSEFYRRIGVRTIRYSFYMLVLSALLMLQLRHHP